MSTGSCRVQAPLAVLFVLANAGWSGAAERTPVAVHGFLDRNCKECHTGPKVKGDYALDRVLAGTASSGEVMRSFESALEMIAKGEMPPAKQPQLPAAERQAALAALRAHLDANVDDRGPRYAGPFARRLNREELQNDLFDVLGIDRTLYQLHPFEEWLPLEGRTDGFDTVGYGLGQSALLLGVYQEYVEHYLALASDDYPAPQRWRIKFGHRYLAEKQGFFDGLGQRRFVYSHRWNPEEGPQGPNRNFSVPAFDLTWQLTGAPQPPRRSEAESEQAFRSFFSDHEVGKRPQLEIERVDGGPIIDADQLTTAGRIGMHMVGQPLSVTTSGRYKVRMRVRLRFTDGVAPQLVRVKYFNRSDLFMGKYSEGPESSLRSDDDDRPRPCFEDPERSQPLKPGEWTVLEFEDFRSTTELYASSLAGFTFDFRCESAAKPKGKSAPLERRAGKKGPAVVPTLADLEAYFPFLMEVDYIEVEGPYPLVNEKDRCIPSAPVGGSSPQATAKSCIARLLPHLFRRPLDERDVETYLGIFDRNVARTKDFTTSLRAALCAAFLSPRHLFVSNAATAAKPGTPLPAHELATRLSLFLWSSTPDAELRAAADSGKLTDAATLKDQVRRLLGHPYASELSANFARQWLRLQDIGLNEPDPDLYYYSKRLEEAMVDESLRSFHEILRSDGSIRLFLDSDWILVNQELASLYKCGFNGTGEAKPFSSWRKVPVSAVPSHAGLRGGLLGQASVLKLTSGSIRTSIVSRGMFILENILGDPPPPPPANVGEIANAVANLEQKSVREQLEIHRQRASCAACHQKIDPLGFALENYGAIGQWRTTETGGMKPIVEEVSMLVPFNGGTKNEIRKKVTERQGHPVDTKAVVMGTAVDGPRELRKLLLAKDDVFARCLVAKLMTYGLGRSLRHQDQAVIERIVVAAKPNGLRLRDLIELVVLSDSFRTY